MNFLWNSQNYILKRFLKYLIILSLGCCRVLCYFQLKLSNVIHHPWLKCKDSVLSQENARIVCVVPLTCPSIRPILHRSFSSIINNVLILSLYYNNNNIPLVLLFGVSYMIPFLPHYSIKGQKI